MTRPRLFNRSMVSMIVLVVLIGMGERMAERFLPLYLLALGGGAHAVGLLNALQNFLGAVYSWPGGWLSDRLGHKNALLLFTAIALAGYAIVIAVPAWPAVFVGATLFLAWTAVTLPAVMSLVAKTVPKERRAMGVTIHSFVRRIPMAAGPVIGGLLIARYGRVDGVRVAFALAFALGLVAVWFLHRHMADAPGKAKGEGESMTGMFRHLRGPLRQLLVSDILIRFAEHIPYAFVVVYVVDHLKMSEVQFGVLSTLEMATAMLIYIPVAWFADRHGKKPFVAMTFVFFTAFPLVLWLSTSFTALCFAFVVRGLKEFGEPTRKALIMDLSPEGAKAGAFGVYYLVRDLAVSAAALTSSTLWNISPGTNLMVAFACGVVGTLLFLVYGKDVVPAAAAEEPPA